MSTQGGLQGSRYFIVAVSEHMVPRSSLNLISSVTIQNSRLLFLRG